MARRHFKDIAAVCAVAIAALPTFAGAAKETIYEGKIYRDVDSKKEIREAISIINAFLSRREELKACSLIVYSAAGRVGSIYGGMCHTGTGQSVMGCGDDSLGESYTKKIAGIAVTTARRTALINYMRENCPGG